MRSLVFVGRDDDVIYELVSIVPSFLTSPVVDDFAIFLSSSVFVSFSDGYLLSLVVDEKLVTRFDVV